jgi:hypothetical protein
VGRADALRIAKAAGEGPRRAIAFENLCLIQRAALHLWRKQNETIMSRHHRRYWLDAPGIWASITEGTARWDLDAYARRTIAVRDLNELVGWLKANKASAGIIAGDFRLITISFQRQISATLTLVPYRGGAPAVQDLAAGQIDILIATPLSRKKSKRHRSLRPCRRLSPRNGYLSSESLGFRRNEPTARSRRSMLLSVIVRGSVDRPGS